MTSTPKAHESIPVQVSPLRKRSTCETGGVNKAEYNTPLHVGALFIILCVSTLACAFPIMATKFPGLRIPTRFFFAVRHFGTASGTRTTLPCLVPLLLLPFSLSLLLRWSFTRLAMFRLLRSRVEPTMTLRIATQTVAGVWEAQACSPSGIWDLFVDDHPALVKDFLS
ncbi:hypothetical protein LB505_008295 [Fusarium chuoi]|nr:hypothetical protein LB505_008295 [Fusarium chuoi]